MNERVIVRSPQFAIRITLVENVMIFVMELWQSVTLRLLIKPKARKIGKRV